MGFDSQLSKEKKRKEKQNQHQAIRREFEPIGSTMSRTPWCRVGFTADLAVGGFLFVKFFNFHALTIIQRTTPLLGFQDLFQ